LQSDLRRAELEKQKTEALRIKAYKATIFIGVVAAVHVALEVVILILFVGAHTRK
jgi:hypothetical protein